MNFIADHWTNVLESLDDGLIVLNEDGRVQYMNQGAAALTGLSTGLVLGQKATDVLRGNRWVPDMLEATTSGIRNVQAHTTFVDRHGHARPVRAASTILVDPAGRRIGSVISLHDRSYENEIESRSRESDRLGQLEILLAGLAHEIKNPLSGMRGAAQILASGNAADGARRECTRIIIGEIDRLNALMTQLLDLSGPARLEREVVNVHEIIDRVFAIEEARRTDVRLVRAFDPSLPCVKGDRGRLMQVLLNLVRNAIEISPAGGTVVVTTRMEMSFYVADARGRENFLSVDVTDRGPGIPPGNREKIFAPFFTTKAGGSGLGLAISQRIVTEHGGALRLQDDTGRGTTFTLTLPVDRTNTHG